LGVWRARKQLPVDDVAPGSGTPELRIVDDQIGAPTSSECIAQATADILAQLLAPAGGGLDGRSGIYNLTSSGETSWWDLQRRC
jgi:dTDP-4-dehydrorhamnose reductase